MLSLNEEQFGWHVVFLQVSNSQYSISYFDQNRSFLKALWNHHPHFVNQHELTPHIPSSSLALHHSVRDYAGQRTVQYCFAYQSQNLLLIVSLSIPRLYNICWPLVAILPATPIDP